jgi:hypothetical protein
VCAPFAFLRKKDHGREPLSTTLWINTPPYQASVRSVFILTLTPHQVWNLFTLYRIPFPTTIVPTRFLLDSYRVQVRRSPLMPAILSTGMSAGFISQPFHRWHTGADTPYAL